MSLKARIRAFMSSEPPSAPGPLDDFWYQPNPRLSVDDAMSVAAVYRCVTFLSSLIAGLPFQVYERNENDDGRKVARNHPLYGVIHDQPNDRYTAFEFWEAVVQSLAIHGNALAVQTTDGRNNVSDLMLLDWAKVRVRKDREMAIRVFDYTEDGQTRSFVDSEVLYIPGPGYDGMSSPSPLAVNAKTIGLSKAALDYVRNYFERGAIPPAYLSFPAGASLNEATLTKWYNWFRSKFMGSNSGVLGVVPNGGEIKTVQLPHREMQLVELRQEQVIEICRIFGIPPHLAFELSRSTNNNIENQDIGVAKYTAKPWTKRIEARVNISCLGPQERKRFFCEFNLMALTEGDAQAQAEIMKAEIGSGVRAPNEWRSLRNLAPKPGGDDLYMNGANMRLQDIPSADEVAQQGVANAV